VTRGCFADGRADTLPLELLRYRDPYDCAACSQSRTRSFAQDDNALLASSLLLRLGCGFLG
jgi:hypothetical protein